MNKLALIFSPLLLCASFGFAQTIEEKKMDLEHKSTQRQESDHLLLQTNQRIVSLKKELNAQYLKAKQLSESGANESEFAQLLDTTNQIKKQLIELHSHWKDTLVGETKRDEEGYALWDQEETTLDQLVMEYGAPDFLYVIPTEMANIKINMHSNIAIPRESWSDVLEMILSYQGIGVKAINTYARQLFILKQEPSAIQAIVSRPEDLRWLHANERLFYVLSPPPEQIKTIAQFLERFSDAKQVMIQQIGSKIAIIAPKAEVEKMLSIYQTVWQDPKGKISKVVPVAKMNAKEMEKILQQFFAEVADRTKPPFVKNDSESLSIFAPSQGNGLVLVGNREVVDRAEKIVKETEDQLQDPAEMTVFLYTCKHSSPTDLAKILDKVYYSLVRAIPENKENLEASYTAKGTALQNPPDGYAPSPPLTVPPQTFKPEVTSKLEVEQDSDHFIADPKTGNLLMVVRRDVLTKIKDLLKRLDIPKRMVQIEVLLFEKKLNYQTSYGLNLLKLGSHNGMRYEGPSIPGSRGIHDLVGRGVLAFLFKGDKSKHFPAYDFAYSFLMTQEDVRLNAAPSIITVNQTPATIGILEEISINNGAAPIDTNKGIAFEKSFSRAQYGIQIILTPIIHLSEEEPDEKGFVTLQTNITFDTTQPSVNDRPRVDRRHIENEVRVVDGQTIILGGLRRKASHDNQDKVPFLGEIPGLGKLFGSTKLIDNNTELFFFITPKIISDPKEQLLQVRQEQLKKRPGDVPEFLKCVIEAREKESRKYFSQSLQMLFKEALP